MEALRDGDQQLIAGLVPEGVIDLLEVVDIDEEDRGERVAAAAQTLEGLLDDGRANRLRFGRAP